MLVKIELDVHQDNMSNTDADILIENSCEEGNVRIILQDALGEEHKKETRWAIVNIHDLRVALKKIIVKE